LAVDQTVEIETYFGESRQRISRETVLIAVICCCLAILLRVVALGTKELFGDEFFALDYATGDRPNLFREIFHGHLPLYYEILRGWTKLFGASHDWILRIPSALFGVAAWVAFFFYAFRYLRGLAFVIALVVFALNPTAVAVSNEASSFALLTLWVVLSNYFCVRALDEGGRREWTLWAIASVGGFLTHPFFWFLLLAQFVFGLLRPRKTPRGFIILSATGIFLIIAALVGGVLYAQFRMVGVRPDAPSLADLARGLVAMTLGNFPRYAYGDRVFVRSLLYLLVLTALVFSWIYYRKREAEAEALPENVVWVDETQDVVGKWTRLSLASFLMYQWVTFVVPAFCIMCVGGFASGMYLRPEYFLVCLPSVTILVAAGIDGAPGRVGTIALSVLFVIIMSYYNLAALTDTGYGVKKAFRKMASKTFSPAEDVFLVVVPSGLERSLQRYNPGIPTEMIHSRDLTQPDQINGLLERLVEKRERVFVLYHDDFRRIGKSDRSLVREWFGLRKNIFETDDKWTLSPPEKTELRIYKRIDPTKSPPKDE